MSSRRNFLDADNNIMERNLRFVQNDLEDNLNQYFGGSGSRGNSTAISAPPRDYKVVQPKPENFDEFLETRHFLDERRKFLLQIGLPRNDAHGLAKKTRFDVAYYKEERNKLLKEGLLQAEVDIRIHGIIKNGDYKRDNNNDRLEYKMRRAAEREMAKSEEERNCFDLKMDSKMEDSEVPAAPREIEWNKKNKRRDGHESHGHRRRSPSPLRKIRRNDSPSKYKEIQNHSRRSRSPIRNERYMGSSPPRGLEWNNKNSRLSSQSPLRYNKKYEHDSRKVSTTPPSSPTPPPPPINITCYPTSRSKSPPRGECMPDDREFRRNVNNSPSRYYLDERYSNYQNEEKATNRRSFRLSRSHSPTRNLHDMQNDKWFGRNVNNSPSADRRSRSPTKDSNFGQEALWDQGFGRNVNSPSRSLNYNAEKDNNGKEIEEETEFEYFQSLRSCSPGQNEREFGRNVKNSPSRFSHSNNKRESIEGMFSHAPSESFKYENKDNNQKPFLQSSHGNELRGDLKFKSFQSLRSHSPVQDEREFRRNVNNAPSRFSEYSNTRESNNKREFSHSRLENELKREDNSAELLSTPKHYVNPQAERQFERNYNNSSARRSNYIKDREDCEQKRHLHSSFEKEQSDKTEFDSFSNIPVLVTGNLSYRNPNIIQNINKSETLATKTENNTLFDRSNPSSQSSDFRQQYPMHKELKSSKFSYIASRNSAKISQETEKQNFNNTKIMNPSFNKAELNPSKSASFNSTGFARDSGRVNSNFVTSKSSQISTKHNFIHKETVQNFGKPATFVPQTQFNTSSGRSAAYSLNSGSGNQQHSMSKELKSSKPSTVVSGNAALTDRISKESENKVRNLSIKNNPGSFGSNLAIDALPDRASPSYVKIQTKSSFGLILNKTPSSSNFSKAKPIKKSSNLTWSKTNSPSINTDRNGNLTWSKTTSTSINTDQKQSNPPPKNQPQFLKSLKIENSTSPAVVSKLKASTGPDPSKVLKEKKPKAKKVKRVDVYKRRMANFVLIKMGFKKPLEGHLKANPKEYWSRWWSVYKYIANALIEVDPEDVYQDLHMTFEPHDPRFRTYKNFLLRAGVNKIFRYLRLDERKYPYADSYRLFKYKKRLEDPKFQKALRPFDLKIVQDALRCLKNKRRITFLHQALIARWHSSMDIVKRASKGEMIKFRSARGLLRNSTFNYLVFESIQTLKKLCQEDWPEFEDFYNNLQVVKFDRSDIELLQNYRSKDDSSDDEDDDEY